MAKLATARESRMYGPRQARNRWEYINAGIYVFATILLIGGLAAQLSPGQLDHKSGLVVMLIATALVTAVNGHDLVAHMAGIDYCLALVEFDPQLAMVEFAVPFVLMLGSVLVFIAILFLVIQMERGYSDKLEHHALNMLIAGPVLWVIGSIHNLCQVYERANGHVQILQKSVQIPFLMGSQLFLVGGIFNRHDIFGSIHHRVEILGMNWVWLCTFGSLLFLTGGLLNVVKVFKMQQMDSGVRLEKLRGGAQERLAREREGKVPLILEDNRRRRLDEEARPAPSAAPAPYKDVLVAGGRSQS